MPTKSLPATPRLEHLRAQAKDLLKAHRAHALDANQRIREFHPRFRKSDEDTIAAAPLKLSDAQLAIAREYGFSSWTRLKRHIENPQRENLSVPQHERIHDPAFRKAVELLDLGDVEGLRAHLHAHPQLARTHLEFEGGNYFRDPTLLEFVAENPTRRGHLPHNIVQVATVILDEGAKDDRGSLNSTLGLVASSAVARECNVQIPLIDLLAGYGADVNVAVLPALLYGEFAAVTALLQRGASMSLIVAAATGRYDDARATLSGAGTESRQIALALAAQYGHDAIVALLLDAGEDPNRYSPVGTHSHATPLHQAALAGHERAVRVLLERGARADIKDILYHATPEGWADYAGHAVIAELLRGTGR